MPHVFERLDHLTVCHRDVWEVLEASELAASGYPKICPGGIVSHTSSQHLIRPRPRRSFWEKSGNNGLCGNPSRGTEPNPVNAEQAMRIAVAFARAAAQSPSRGLCSACAELLVVSGAGITVMGGASTGPVCVSSNRVAALEDLQFTMGIGPCRDAFTTGRPVHAASFDHPASSRWPSFVVQARQAGIGAVFAYPLSSNGARVGVMTLYQDGEGDLGTSQHQDSIVVAQIITETILSLQDAAPAGTLSKDLSEIVAYRAQVHQASGMVSIQLEISVADALLRIRAHAFSNDRSTGLVAADIVAGRLRLVDDRDERGERV